MSTEIPKAQQADIALLLEGTYPYISGGVSSWVQQILNAYPKYKFAIVFLGSKRDDYGEFRYTLPANVVHFEEHFLYDDPQAFEEPTFVQGSADSFEKIKRLFTLLEEDDGSEQSKRNILDEILAVTQAIRPGGGISLRDFLHSEEAWGLLRESYQRYSTDPSFVDFFWTVRMMFRPLWLLAEVAEKLIPVRTLHTVSTGYAGFLGGLLHHQRQLPLILSEHGIYTKERQIDLLKSSWIRDNRNIFQRDPMEVSFFRQMWIHFFSWMGRFCYDAANPIVALYELNRLRQINDGASAERTLNIPNGIRIERFRSLRDMRTPNIPPVLCLIGRVVPIKDIKTFIRSMRRIVNKLPQAQAWIAGPTDEDPGYVQECKNLASSLNLQNHVKFLGMQRIEDLMPLVGLVVLSSVSEALPLVILEAQASGVPVVSTDVGSCRQLIEGLDADDQSLGSCGQIVGIANPEALADASLELLSNPQKWQEASSAGIARVERYYTDTLLFERYRQIYDNALDSSKEPR